MLITLDEIEFYKEIKSIENFYLLITKTTKRLKDNPIFNYKIIPDLWIKLIFFKVFGTKPNINIINKCNKR